MITFHCFGVKIQISVFYVGIITLLAFIDKTGIAVLGFFAALLHELGHIAVLYLVGGRAELISFEITGIRMVQKSLLGNLKEIAVMSAGCAVNFVCCALCMKLGFLSAATVHLCIGAFNLLPAGALDGGRLSALFFGRFLSMRKTDFVCTVISVITSLTLIFLGVNIFFTSFNPTLLITGVFLLACCGERGE